MSDNILPSQFHRYELVERIAVGGMAEVFRAKTYGVQGFEKELAVKRILPELAANREFVDRFVGEAKIAVTLNHVNIVQVLDFSRFGDSLFIAMEYVDGCDLSTLFKSYRHEGKVLPVAVALYISIEVLKGLDFAHGREVVHRDMSPANILVSKSGEVKVADFGIAQAAGDGSGHTNPFQIMGKWRYMSPEQTRAEPLTAASDLFSTSIMLHEAFTGKRLFDQDEPAQIVRAIRELPIPRLRTGRPELSETLEAIVHKGLSRDPSKRGTASSMMRALIEFSYAQSLPVTAMDLGEVVKNVSAVPPDSSLTSPSESGQLIDDIINSELQHQRPGVQTRLTRITPVDAQQAESTFEDTATGLTFVDGGPGPDGLTQWLIGNAEGGPVTIDSDFDFDVPTVSGAGAGGVTQVPITDLFELAPIAVPSASSPPMPEHMRPPVAIPASVAEMKAGSFASQAQVGVGEARSRKPLLYALIAVGVVVIFVLMIITSADKGPASASLPTGEGEIAEGEPNSATEVRGEDVANPKLDGDLQADLDPAMELDPSDAAPEMEPELEFDPETEMVIEPDDPPESSTIAISLKSSPEGATVSLGGRRVGTTPMSLSLPQADTPKTLRMRLDGFRVHSQTLDLRLAEPQKIRVRLRKLEETKAGAQFGKIDLFVKPWANVYFRGSKIAEAPARGVRLPHGTHKLRLENPVTGQKRTVTVTVPASKAYRFTLTGGS